MNKFYIGVCLSVHPDDAERLRKFVDGTSTLPQLASLEIACLPSPGLLSKERLVAPECFLSGESRAV